MKKGQGFGPHGRQPQQADPRTLEEIQRRTPKVAGRVELHNTPAGTRVTPLDPEPRQEYTLPFWPQGFHYDQERNQTNAILAPAWVLLRHVEAKDDTEEKDGGLWLEEPQIKDVGLWAHPPPHLELAGDRSFNYLTFNTNPLGLPTTQFNVISDSNKRNTVHHIPPDPGGGNATSGEYYVLLFETDFANTDYHGKVLHKWGGNYPWYVGLWAGDHPALVGAQPYLGFAENVNRHHFRTHFGGHAHNIYQDHSGFANMIYHEWCGRNIGTEETNIGNVYTGNTSATCAEFNILHERNAGEVQIRVRQTGNESPIQISGNHNDVTITIREASNTNNKIELVFSDGLLKSPYRQDTTVDL